MVRADATLVVGVLRRAMVVAVFASLFAAGLARLTDAAQHERGLPPGIQQRDVHRRLQVTAKERRPR
jgi:hypothetical protein